GAGRIGAVSARPNPPGVNGVDRSGLKGRSQPRPPCAPGADSITPKYTSPSGPMVGEEVALSSTIAGAPVTGSTSSTLALTASVALSSATRYPFGWSMESTATYSVLPSSDSAGALFIAACVTVASLEMAEALTQLPAPSALTRAMPPPGSGEAPPRRKPKYALPAPSTVTGVSAMTAGSSVRP